MTKEDFLKEIKYYTGLILSEDSIYQIDIDDYIKFEKNSIEIYNNENSNHDYDLLIDYIMLGKYNYLQERYNM
jgi:hypothetical protein